MTSYLTIITSQLPIQATKIFYIFFGRAVVSPTFKNVTPPMRVWRYTYWHK